MLFVGQPSIKSNADRAFRRRRACAFAGSPNPSAAMAPMMPDDIDPAIGRPRQNASRQNRWEKMVQRLGIRFTLSSSPDRQET
jgi:hypothetical protein